MGRDSTKDRDPTHECAARAHVVELWGGVECTVNRVGDTYLDQLNRSGHAVREDDIDAFHALGLKTLRYPCLWERTAPLGPERADWRWTDARLGRLARVGMRPIVGLVHHGSGPAWTSLLEDSFVDGVAAYAAAFARRYPWVEAYTPVNEPNTTARFSALYGHWYPHGRDDASFSRALIIQCRAIVEAMRAVRAVNAAARLVQTDDAGRTVGTPGLAYQAEFERERRWLAWDLLFGRVDAQHPLWPWLRHHGVSQTQLEWFLSNRCPPDIVGLNYYLTSDRYLDDRLHRYPPRLHGHNGRQPYVDVDAVRVQSQTIVGHEDVLRGAWERYKTPVALTEVHLGCSRDDQLRWLMAAWNGARDAATTGVDVRAVCVWALLGSHDWTELVTRSGVHYEAGVFDVRSTPPRLTALATIVRSLAATGQADHPVLSSPGWWARPHRVLYGSLERPRGTPPTRQRPLLITGGAGRLATGFARRCRARGLASVALTRRLLDVTDAGAVAAALERHRPWAVINTAGFAGVDEAETEPAACWRNNVDGVEVLCEAAARASLPLVTFSSDLVFDGRLGRPYVETDAPAPLSIYGLAKAEAERVARRSGADTLVVRTGALFGPWDRGNFAARCVAALRRGQAFRAARDLTVSPAYVPHVVDATLDLLIDGECGIWHLTNAGRTTWSDVATGVAELAGLDASLVEPCAAAELGFRATRPAQSVLESVRGDIMPPLGEALHAYIDAARANDPDQ